MTPPPKRTFNFPQSLLIHEKPSPLLPSTSTTVSTPSPAPSSAPTSPRPPTINLHHARSSSLPSNTAHHHLFTLRSRRLIAQVTMVIFVFSMVAVWMLGGPGATLDIIRFGAQGPELATESDATLPGVVIGSGGKYEVVQGDSKSGGSGESDTGLGEVGGDSDGVDVSGDGQGSDSVPAGDVEPSPPPKHGHASLRPPTDPLQRWGIQLPDSAHLLAGLSPWLPNAESQGEPLSSLGHFADNIYKAGPRSLPAYRVQLKEFVEVAFPDALKPSLREGIKRYLSTGEGKGGLEEQEWDQSGKDGWQHIWMTDKLGEHAESTEVMGWKKQASGWSFDLLSDDDANKWIKEMFGQVFGVNHIELMWNSLPSGILRADALRYLLLLMRGGIYSDTDTRLLQPPSAWGRGPRLWKGGEDWLDDETRERVDRDGIDEVLGRPSVVVGIEADVGTREDWFDWWPRPIQIVQWTMASAPYHPIALSAVLRIIHSTADAADWAKKHWYDVKNLRGLGMYEEADKLMSVNVLSEPKEGGPVGVMAWTGPGVWTDAVLSYVRVKYGMQWTDLRGIQEPLRVGDVLFLPVTGFSPGVGNFGSQPPFHHQAMVQHLFRGSWKTDQ